MALTGECKKVRFMHNNFIDATTATLSASSQLTGFEVSNLLNVSRTKLWKAIGNFQIHTGNNKLYADDGAPFDVTITSGSYSGSSLATEIQSQLNATSSGWTVSYSTSTYLFSINRVAGFIIFSNQTNAIWDDIGFTGAVDIALTGSAINSDEIRIHNYEFIDIDLGSSVASAEFIGFIGPLSQEISISSNAVVKVQADNVPIALDSTPLFDLTLTHNDRGYLEFFDAISDTAYRYWRVLIQDKTNGNGPQSIAMGYLYLGDYLSFTSTNVARGFSKNIVDPSTVQATPSGRRYFNKRSPYNQLSGLQIQLPNRAERLAFEQFSYDHGVTDPFFISLDPGSRISDELHELTYFVNFESLPNFGHRFIDYYDIQPFTVREVV